MIHHVIMWRLRDEAKRSSWQAIVERLQSNVAAMRVNLSGVLRLEVGINEREGSDAADLLLYGEFESWDALAGYEKHPLHDELRALIAPVRIERRVVDYET
jgi:Stress responsive A/B Barrel Domain